MGNKIDCTNKKFNKLRVIKENGRHPTTGWVMFDCVCDCGQTTNVSGVNLRNGTTKSCGCLQKEVASKTCVRVRTQHGEAPKSGVTRLYRTYAAIKKRCNSDDYRWGGKGVKCQWNSFEEFRRDMGESYFIHIKNFGEEETSIDRIDNNGDYCKENCRWATNTVQARNKSTNVFLKYHGESKCIAEWAELLDIDYQFLYRRLRKHNFNLSNTIKNERLV